jgi:hypothetical protein
MSMFLIEGRKVSRVAAAPDPVPEGTIVVRALKDLTSGDLTLKTMSMAFTGLGGKIAKGTTRDAVARMLWAKLKEMPEQPTKAKVAPKAKKGEPAQTKASGRDSKAQTVLGLLRRGDGATITDLTEATGWQAHSVRGFLSGTVKKKMGIAVSSTKGEDRVRRYRIAA